MAEMRLLMKAKVKTAKNKARMQLIAEELRELDESVQTASAAGKIYT